MASPFDSLGFVAGSNLDDTRFSSDELLAAETLLADAWSARFPDLDFSPSGGFYDLLVRPRALVYLLSKTETQAALATGSLRSVTENPALASDAVVDAILSNWGVARHPGRAATGFVRVTVNRSAIYPVPASQSFTTAQGQTFAPDQAYLALPNPTAPNHLKLYAADASGDQFYFLVPVVASAVGLASQLAGEVALVPAPTFPNLVRCASFGAFGGAVDGETAAALIARLPEGLSAKNLVSRAALRGAVRAAFPDLQSLTVQGFGDPALRRGGDNVFGIKTPGRADVWVRTLPALETRTVPGVAVRLNFNADGTASYLVELPAVQTRGAYLVSAVRAADTTAATNLGTYPLGEQIRGSATEAWPPGQLRRTLSPAEAAFSAYATIGCEFTVSPGDGELTPTLAVAVDLLGQPNVPEIQLLLDDPDTRAAGCDSLARAAIPCFCAVSPATVYADQSVDPAVLRTTLYQAIVGTPPGTPLTVDALVLALRNVPGVSRVDLPIRLAGQIWAPDGAVIARQSQNALAIPEFPQSQVVPETCAFFVDLDDLPLNVVFD